MEEILLGTTDRTILVFIADPAQTDGSGKTGLNAAALTVSYTRVETDNDVVVTDVTSSLSDLTALTDAHTDWGVKEVSSTLAPGLYRLDIADAVFAAGAWYAAVYVCITTSLAAPAPKVFKLVNLDMQSQSAADLKDFADDGYDPSTNKVQGVVLTDTVTTYTGNTPQTGDSFARIGANGASLTDLGGMSTTMKAQVQTEAEEALQTYHLDHLIASADPGAIVANNSFLAKLVSKSATAAFSSYDNTTDSLEALRDRGDAAWITATGFSTHTAADVWAAATRTLTSAANITSTGGTITVSGGVASAQLAAGVTHGGAETLLRLETSASTPPLVLINTHIAGVAAQIDGALAGMLVSGSIYAASFTASSGPGIYIGSANTYPPIQLVEDGGSQGISPIDAAIASRSSHSAADVWTSTTRTLSTAGNAAVADATWDEAIAGHLGAGSTGAALNAAGAAGDPWTTVLPGAYGAGSAGYIVGNNLNATVGSRSSHSAADVWTSGTRTLTAFSFGVTVGTGGITTASFAAGAIDAAAIAANAIGASELATDAVAEIADAVWDEAIAGHLTAGSTGAALNGAGSAGDPWTTPLPGAYGSGTAGYIIGTYLTGDVILAVNSLLETQVPGTFDIGSVGYRIGTFITGDAFLRMATYRLGQLLSESLVAPVAGSLFAELTEDDGGVQRFTANALEQAPAGGGGGLGTGARTVTITVRRSDTLAVVEGARVRMTKDLTSPSGLTNASGVIVFNVDDGTDWAVAITHRDYNFFGAELDVDGNEAATYDVTPRVATPSPPGSVTGYLNCVDEAAADEENVSVTVTAIKAAGSTGVAIDSTPRTEVSNAYGYVEFVGMVIGVTYTVYRGSGGGVIRVTIPDDADDPYPLSSVIGSP